MTLLMPITNNILQQCEQYGVCLLSSVFVCDVLFTNSASFGYNEINLLFITGGLPSYRIIFKACY